MTTEVRFHEDIIGEMATWIATDPRRAVDRHQVLRVYLQDIVETLYRTEGAEEELEGIGAIRAPGLEPPLYDWHYSGDLWVRFAVRHEARWVVLTICRVTVLHLSQRRLDPPEP